MADLRNFTFDELRPDFVNNGAGITHPELVPAFLLFRYGQNQLVKRSAGVETPYALTAKDKKRADWRIV